MTTMQAIALAEYMRDSLVPLDARLDGTDVAENSAGKVSGQAIVEPAGVGSRIVAAIADKYSASTHCFLLRLGYRTINVRRRPATSGAVELPDQRVNGLFAFAGFCGMLETGASIGD